MKAPIQCQSMKVNRWPTLNCVHDKYCYKINRLGSSDYNPILLIPKYKPISKQISEKIKVPVRVWNGENTEKLLCSIETTDWKVLTSQVSNVSEHAEIVTDYLAFCRPR